MKITAFELAQRFVGIKEIKGQIDNPQILAMLRLDNDWPQGDEVPWCSAFVNYICWLLRLPRSKSLMARSWLGIGRIIMLEEAKWGWDVVVFYRGDVDDGKTGHVGFFAGLDESWIYVLGGNQSDSVNIAQYPRDKLLGCRRLYEEWRSIV